MVSEREAYFCRGCNRPEDECSRNPCREVLVDREEVAIPRLELEEFIQHHDCEEWEHCDDEDTN